MVAIFSEIIFCLNFYINCFTLWKDLNFLILFSINYFFSFFCVFLSTIHFYFSNYEFLCFLFFWVPFYNLSLIFFVLFFFFGLKIFSFLYFCISFSDLTTIFSFSFFFSFLYAAFSRLWIHFCIYLLSIPSAPFKNCILCLDIHSRRVSEVKQRRDR